MNYNNLFYLHIFNKTLFLQSNKQQDITKEDMILLMKLHKNIIKSLNINFIIINLLKIYHI